MWQTRVTKKLGIELPIIGGAMQWLGRSEFVAAVSNAGGLGIIASASFASKEELKAEIRKTRRLTNKPFGVNINRFPSMRPLSIDDMLDALHEEWLEARGENLENILPKMKGELGREAYEAGDLDGAVWACGQSTGLVKEIMPVQAYFQGIIEQAAAIRRLWCT